MMGLQSRCEKNFALSFLILQTDQDVRRRYYRMISVAVAMIRLEELGRGTKRERTSGHEVPQIQAERSHLSQSGMVVLVVKTV